MPSSPGHPCSKQSELSGAFMLPMFLLDVRTGDLDLSWRLHLTHHVSALTCHVSANDYVICIISPVMQWETEAREMPLSLLPSSPGLSACNITNLLQPPCLFPKSLQMETSRRQAVPLRPRKCGAGSERTSASFSERSEKQMLEKCVTKLCPGKLWMLGEKKILKRKWTQAFPDFVVAEVCGRIPEEL